MKTSLTKTPVDVESAEAGWRNLYKLAAVAALLVVFLGVLDIALSMASGEAQETSAISIVTWFTHFQNNPFETFRLLGLFNIINLLLGIPLFLALLHIHRRANPAFAGLAVIFFSTGTAVYLSSNSVFSIFALSRQYAVADAAQKAVLEVLGQAALAQGADLTPGTFLGFILPEAAGILMAAVLLQGRLFGKIAPWLGILGLGLLAIFNIMAAFAPAAYNTAMTFAMLGGPLSMAYYLLLARRLFQLSKSI